MLQKELTPIRLQYFFASGAHTDVCGSPNPPCGERAVISLDFPKATFYFCKDCFIGIIANAKQKGKAMIEFSSHGRLHAVVPLKALEAILREYEEDYEQHNKGALLN